MEWVPVCPEVEAGLGTPRDAMRLVGDPKHPRLVTIETGRDMTKPLFTFSQRKVKELKQAELSGFVFKKDSPSCGIERVRVFNQHGVPSRNGAGLFATSFMKSYPLVPVEDEGRLGDSSVREHFIERVIGYRQWRALSRKAVARESVVAFHAAHKFLSLAHNRAYSHALDRLVAQGH